MLTGLGHGTVGRSHDQDSAVHLGSTGDHVLDVVGVARAVNVSVVTVLGLVLNVSGVDRDATSALLGSLIDVGVVHEVCVTLQGQNLGDGGSQSGLAVVNVADGADVNMRLRTVKFCLFSHWNILPLKRFLVITASRLHKMRCKAILLDYPFKIKRFSRNFPARSKIRAEKSSFYCLVRPAMIWSAMFLGTGS